MTQARAARAVADELANASAYDAIFGRDAPPAGVLAEQLRGAAALEAEEARAGRWLAYVTTNKLEAWNTAMTTAGRLQDEYDHVVQNHPEVAERFPQMNGFFSVRKEIAAHGAETRAKNKKKQSAPPATGSGTGGA